MIEYYHLKVVVGDMLQGTVLCLTVELGYFVAWQQKRTAIHIADPHQDFPKLNEPGRGSGLPLKEIGFCATCQLLSESDVFPAYAFSLIRFY